MELPHLGKHCSHPSCKKLDFLPIKCDICSQIFCDEHYSYVSHNCENAYLRDNQVPVCPLCNKPVPVPQGQQPDRVVGAHIDNDCQSDPAKNKRKVFTNRCSLKGCKVREVIPVVCEECGLNYCLKHRHERDHQCQGRQGAGKHKMLNAALARQQNSNTAQVNQMSEDEALARAIALSMQDPKGQALSQEELDLALARQLQASEYRGTTATTAARSNNTRDRCSVV